MSKNINKVVEIYKDVNIRKCNRVALYFGISDFKKLIDAADDTGLSIHKILAYSGQPCEKCKNISVIIFDKDGDAKKIKKGILRMPENNGINIIQKAKLINNKK